MSGIDAAGHTANKLEQSLATLIVPALDGVASALNLGVVKDNLNGALANLTSVAQSPFEAVLRAIRNPVQNLLQVRSDKLGTTPDGGSAKPLVGPVPIGDGTSGYQLWADEDGTLWLKQNPNVRVVNAVKAGIITQDASVSVQEVERQTKADAASLKAAQAQSKANKPVPMMVNKTANGATDKQSRAKKGQPTIVDKVAAGRKVLKGRVKAAAAKLKAGCVPPPITSPNSITLGINLSSGPNADVSSTTVSNQPESASPPVIWV